GAEDEEPFARFRHWTSPTCCSEEPPPRCRTPVATRTRTATTTIQKRIAGTFDRHPGRDEACAWTVLTAVENSRGPRAFASYRTVCASWLSRWSKNSRMCLAFCPKLISPLRETDWIRTPVPPAGRKAIETTARDF